MSRHTYGAKPGKHAKALTSVKIEQLRQRERGWRYDTLTTKGINEITGQTSCKQGK